MTARRRARALEAGPVSLLPSPPPRGGLVLAQVSYATGYALSDSLPCLVHTSDRCSLAMALCKNWHFLGIKRYHAEAFWISGFLAACALIAARYIDRLER